MHKPTRDQGTVNIAYDKEKKPGKGKGKRTYEELLEETPQHLDAFLSWRTTGMGGIECGRGLLTITKDAGATNTTSSRMGNATHRVQSMQAG